LDRRSELEKGHGSVGKLEMVLEGGWETKKGTGLVVVLVAVLVEVLELRWGHVLVGLLGEMMAIGLGDEWEQAMESKLVEV